MDDPRMLLALTDALGPRDAEEFLTAVVESPAGAGLLTAMLNHPHCPGAVLASLATSGVSPEVAVRILSHPNCPPETRRALRTDPSLSGLPIRVEGACEDFLKNLPRDAEAEAAALLQLTQDGSTSLLIGLSRHARAQVIAEVARGPFNGSHATRVAAIFGTFPREMFTALRSTLGESEAISLLARLTSDQTSLANWLADPRQHRPVVLQRSLAGHVRANPVLWTSLVLEVGSQSWHDSSLGVLEVAANHPATSLTLLEEWALDPSAPAWLVHDACRNAASSETARSRIAAALLQRAAQGDTKAMLAASAVARTEELLALPVEVLLKDPLGMARPPQSLKSARERLAVAILNIARVNKAFLTEVLTGEGSAKELIERSTTAQRPAPD